MNSSDNSSSQDPDSHDSEIDDFPDEEEYN
jgi:hypothetical protein